MRKVHVATVFVVALCASLLWANIPFLDRDATSFNSNGPTYPGDEGLIGNTGTSEWAPSFGPAPIDGQEAWFYTHLVTANETVTWNISHNLPANFTVESNGTSFTVEGVSELGDRGAYWINASALSVAGQLATTHNWTFNLTMAWASTISPPAHDAYVNSYYEHQAVVNESIMGVIAYYDLPDSFRSDIDFWNATFTIYGTPLPGEEGTYSVNYTVISLDGKMESNVVWNFTIHPAPDNPPNLTATAAVIIIVIFAALVMRRWP